MVFIGIIGAMERDLHVPRLVEKVTSLYGYPQYSKGPTDEYALVTLGERHRIRLPSFGEVLHEIDATALYFNDPNEIFERIKSARDIVASWYNLTLTDEETMPVVKKGGVRLLNPRRAHVFAAAQNIAVRATHDFLKNKLKFHSFGLATAGSSAEGLAVLNLSDADIIVCLQERDFLLFIDTVKNTSGYKALNKLYRHSCEACDDRKILSTLFPMIHTFFVPAGTVQGEPRDWVAGKELEAISFNVHFWR